MTKTDRPVPNLIVHVYARCGLLLHGLQGCA
jgi:hypothetical protein